MSLPVGGHGCQKCETLIDRMEAEVIVLLVLIGLFQFRKFDDFIPEIECCHTRPKELGEFWNFMTVMLRIFLRLWNKGSSFIE